MDQNKDIIAAAEKIVADAYQAGREEFYSDDSVWQHEDCGVECDGTHE